MSNIVIAISRQYGAAGREIATKVAEKLGVHLYDRQLVHIAALPNFRLINSTERRALKA